MELSKKLIKKLKSNPDFQEFSDYVMSKVTELDTVDHLNGMSNEHAGQEAKVRFHTKWKLYEILEPVIDFVDREDDLDERKAKRVKKYALE